MTDCTGRCSVRIQSKFETCVTPVRRIGAVFGGGDTADGVRDVVPHRSMTSPRRPRAIGATCDEPGRRGIGAAVAARTGPRPVNHRSRDRGTATNLERTRRAFEETRSTVGRPAGAPHRSIRRRSHPINPRHGRGLEIALPSDTRVPARTGGCRAAVANKNNHSVKVDPGRRQAQAASRSPQARTSGPALLLSGPCRAPHRRAVRSRIGPTGRPRGGRTINRPNSASPDRSARQPRH